YIFTGQHEQHAARCPRPTGVDAGDAGMRVRRAQHMREHGARRQQVVDEAPATGEEALVLDAARAGAEAAHSTFTPVRSTTAFQVAASRRRRSATSPGGAPPAIQPCSTKRLRTLASPSVVRTSRAM